MRDLALYICIATTWAYWKLSAVFVVGKLAAGVEQLSSATALTRGVLGLGVEATEHVAHGAVAVTHAMAGVTGLLRLWVGHRAWWERRGGVGD